MLIAKIKNRVWREIVVFSRNKFYYSAMYSCWWYSLFHKSDFMALPNSYLTAVPNSGAGIGHQMANWIAGLWFSRDFRLHHAHIKFPSSKWEGFLGFGDGKDSLDFLLKERGFQKVLLPLFDEFNKKEVDQIRKIIASYHNKNIVFVLEQDQFYRDQFGVIDEIQNKFYSAEARKNDQLRYSCENYNIAIHVRRGDIVVGQTSRNSNLLMRWQDGEYFKIVLRTVLNSIKTEKKIRVYLFSQGIREEFSDFEEFDNLEYCLEFGAQESFLHMVFADLLITSKSSFSYKPALLSKGIKICPQNFWHGYPDNIKWITVDESGIFTDKEIRKLKEI
jgi:hypothetical protein